MTKLDLEFKDPEIRGKHATRLRELFNQNGLEYWWVSPSVKTNEIFISPRNYGDWQKEAYHIISRISVQIDSEGKSSFGISGYLPQRIECQKQELENRGYKYHQHIDRRGKMGRWWLIKKLDCLEDITNEFKSIEYLLK